MYDDTLKTGTNFIKFVIWYEKNRKESGDEYRDIKKLADIRPFHVREFLMAKKRVVLEVGAKMEKHVQIKR